MDRRKWATLWRDLLWLDIVSHQAARDGSALPEALSDAGTCR
jgi:hypothetical protein